MGRPVNVLLDSCILIDYLLGHAAAREYLRGVDGAAISIISWMEVLAGAKSPEEELIIRYFLASYSLLAVDAQVAEEAIQVRRSRRLKLPDAIILATAHVHHIDLVTRNTKDFAPREPGIRIPYQLS